MQKYLVFLLCLGLTLRAQADPTADDFALQAGGIAGAVEACGQNITVYSGRVREAIIAMDSNPADQMSAANLYGKSLTNAYARQKSFTQRMACSDILTIYNGLPLMRSDYKQTVLPVLAANNPAHISTAPSATPSAASTTTVSTAPSAIPSTPAAPVAVPAIPQNNPPTIASNIAGADQQQSLQAGSSAQDQLSPQQIAQQQLAQQQSMQNAMAYMQQQAQLNAASPQMQQALADMTTTPVQQEVTADSAAPTTQQPNTDSSSANMVMANNTSMSNSEAADSPYYNERGGDNVAVSPSYSSGN